MNSSAIGLFDSGLGGLTVLKELKSILQNVKLIIIACGTASSQAYDYLIKYSDIPIINVITPTAKRIKGNTIGIIATNGTIKSKAWEKEIQKYSKTDKKIIQKSCPLFVPIVEEGLQNTSISREAIQMYLNGMKKSKIDSLVLGCTHYPLLCSEIKEYLGKDVNIINTSIPCAIATKQFLEKKNMLNNSNSKHFTYACTTDNTSLFKQNSKKFCDVKFDKVNKVTF